MRTTSQLLLTFLFNACWQIALLAAAGTLGARLLRHNAVRFQHLLWVSALVLAFCLPLLTTAFVSRDVLFAKAPRFEESANLTNVPILVGHVEEPDAFTPAKVRSAIPVNARLATLILVGYVVFLGYRMFGLFRAWRRTRRIKKSARVVEQSESLQRIVSECASAFQIDSVSLLGSDSIAVPVTAGVWRPLVILPEELLREADADLLASAIGHELVHVRRRDYLLNLIYELLYLPLSFHPAAAFFRRRINQTREICCDELVADRLLKADVYARSLVRLAGSAPQLRKLAPTTTVGIADADILEVRVMSLLNRSEDRGRGRKLLLIAVALILAVPCAAAAAFSLPFDVAKQELVPQQEHALVEPQEPEKAPVKKDVKAKLLYHPEPEYPAEARAKGIEGRVGLVLTVGADGLVKDVLVTKPLYPSLDESAVANARKWRFEPFVNDGEPSTRRLTAELNFDAGTWQQEKQSREDRELKEKVERELKEKVELEANPTGVNAELEARARRQQIELEMRAKQQAALASLAKITMDQAIQIALRQTGGKVLQCTLIGERWEEPGKLAKDSQVFYRVVIFSGDQANPVTTHVLINALDGTVIKAQPERSAIRGGTLNGKAVHLPSPEYPEIARQAGASGSVAVEVTIDESGKVISARAVSGHPLLQAAAVGAARAAQFSPTRLEGQPVKVSGIITYNFVAN